MIQYDDKLNKEIRRTVKNFNAKVNYNRTKTRGKGMIPQPISTKELKAKYSDKSRSELLKQLKLYQSFGSRNALTKNQISRLSSWENDYFKANYSKTKQFYEDEIKDLKNIIGDKPEYHLRLHPRLVELTSKENFLNKDFSTLTESEIKTMRSVFSEAERSEVTKNKDIRNYLSQLQRTMTLLGYSKQEIDNLINKFNQLSTNEFTEMLRTDDLVDSVYDIIDSPKGRGKYQLMTEENRARTIVETIIEQADDLIAKFRESK